MHSERHVRDSVALLSRERGGHFFFKKRLFGVAVVYVEQVRRQQSSLRQRVLFIVVAPQGGLDLVARARDALPDEPRRVGVKRVVGGVPREGECDHGNVEGGLQHNALREGFAESLVRQDFRQQPVGYRVRSHRKAATENFARARAAKLFVGFRQHERRLHVGVFEYVRHFGVGVGGVVPPRGKSRNRPAREPGGLNRRRARRRGVGIFDFERLDVVYGEDPRRQKCGQNYEKRLHAKIGISRNRTHCARKVKGNARRKKTPPPHSANGSAPRPPPQKA